MNLDGRIITHLSNLLADIESAHSKSTRELENACKRANEDPIFQFIAEEKFSLPTSNSSSLQRLVDQIQRLSTVSHSALQSILKTTDRFTCSYQPRWNQNSYFIVPVVAKTDENVQSLLVYLHAVSEKNKDDLSSGRLNVDDLIQDRRSLSASHDYFSALASVLLETLYLVQTYPLDTYEGLAHHHYELMFGSRVAESKSLGAAALAMFSVVYLQSILGKQFDQVAAPQNGTVLLGDIDRTGKVLPVEYLPEQIEFAIDEFGSGLKLILPRGEELPPRIEREIEPGNIRYVSTAEELLEEVLSSKEGLQGLHQARAALFKNLGPAQKEKLKTYVREGIDPQVYDRIASGQTGWTIPRRHAGGVYAVATAGRDRVDVKLSLELSGLLDESADSSELVEVVLDGSESMNEHWLPNEKTGICRMTAVLYEIKNHIDPKKQQLICGFLSHQRFDSVSAHANAQDLEAQIQDVRRANKLSHRGPFFRPVYEASLENYQDQLKRVFVISDVGSPDLRDVADLNLSSMMHFRLFKTTNTTAAQIDSPVVLYPDGKNLDKTELAKYFKQQSGSIRSVQLDFGNELPLEWEPTSGVLRRTGDQFELSFDNLNVLKYAVRVRLARQYPHEIKISTEVNDGSRTRTFSFDKSPTLTRLTPLNSILSGRLSEDEFEIWKKFETPEWVCPECSSTDSHLLDLPAARTEEVPIFKSLRSLKKGYLLMCRNSADWYFFNRGCQIFGTSFVLLDGRLHWSQARGQIDKVPSQPGFHYLRDKSRTFYICRIT